MKLKSWRHHGKCRQLKTIMQTPIEYAVSETFSSYIIIDLRMGVGQLLNCNCFIIFFHGNCTGQNHAFICWWVQAEFRNQRNILCTNSSVQTETETNLVRSILSTISTVWNVYGSVFGTLQFVITLFKLLVNW